MPNYKRPPIVEAVLEVRVVGSPLDDSAMERLSKRFSERYPAPHPPSNNVGVEALGNDASYHATLRLEPELTFRC